MMGEAIPFPAKVEEPDEIVTRAELAGRQKVSLRTVDRWVAEGCPSETWGMRVRRFRLDRVERWLSNRRAA